MGPASAQDQPRLRPRERPTRAQTSANADKIALVLGLAQRQAHSDSPGDIIYYPATLPPKDKADTMDDLIQGLMSKVGLDKATAEKVIAFLKENANDLPAMLAKSGMADKLPGGLGKSLGGLFGGGD